MVQQPCVRVHDGQKLLEERRGCRCQLEIKCSAVLRLYGGISKQLKGVCIKKLFLSQTLRFKTDLSS